MKTIDTFTIDLPEYSIHYLEYGLKENVIPDSDIKNIDEYIQSLLSRYSLNKPDIIFDYGDFEKSYIRIPVFGLSCDCIRTKITIVELEENKVINDLLEKNFFDFDNIQELEEEDQNYFIQNCELFNYLKTEEERKDKLRMDSYIFINEDYFEQYIYDYLQDCYEEFSKDNIFTRYFDYDQFYYDSKIEWSSCVILGKTFYYEER